MCRLSSFVAACVAAQRGRLLLWAPVCLAVGIGCYFALPVEPRPPIYGALATLCALATLAATRAGETAAPLCLAIALVVAGLLLAGARANQKAAPVLNFRYYGPVEGRVVAVDRSVSDAVRVTLDDVVLLRVGVEQTPERVRVSLHGEQGSLRHAPG